MDVGRITDALRGEGVRLTRQRLAVLAALGRATGAMTPGEILREARREVPHLGLATVYRTVELLEGAGDLRRVHVLDGCEGVALAAAEHGHHVVCSRCGRVAEFSTCDLASTVEAATRETGFAIEEHHLELTGVCPACRAEGARG